MKLKGLRWWIIGLIWLAVVINYIDRAALGVLWPDIRDEFGFTKEDYAWIINIFTFTYALGKLFSGRLYDKVGARIGFVMSIFVWSCAAVLHAFTKGLSSLGLFRGMLGIAEAGPWPGSVKNNNEWFPINERAVAQGIFNSGAAVGSIIAGPTVAELAESFGWKGTFIIIGTLGILWIIPWLIINKTKMKKHPWLSDEEKKHILDGQESESRREEPTLGVAKILGHKESLGLVLSRFFIEPIWWLFVFWMPIYLLEVYGFNIKEIGYYSVIPYIGAALGSIAGGMYVKRLIQNNSVNFSRKRIVLIGNSLIVVGILAAILFADTPDKFVTFVFIVLFGFQFSISNLQTIPSDLFGGKSVGTLAGIAGFIGSVAVMIVNWLVPKITVDSYTPAFILLGVLAPLSVIALFALCKNIRQLNEN